MKSRQLLLESICRTLRRVPAVGSPSEEDPVSPNSAMSLAESSTALPSEYMCTQSLHVGEKATVCGGVVGTHFAARSRGTPTFLNLDKPYPNQVFTVLIWGSDRPKFANPEEAYRDKCICVTGKISNYKGVPEIVAYHPSQINVR